MKRKPKLTAAVKFFMRHAGYPKRPGESTQAAKRRCAEGLALAEAEAERRGWTVKWEHDDLPYETDIEDDKPEEVLVAVLKDENGRTIGSLGGIGDPSRDYGRVVEAELAEEALYERGFNTDQMSLHGVV